MFFFLFSILSFFQQLGGGSPPPAAAAAVFLFLSFFSVLLSLRGALSVRTARTLGDARGADGSGGCRVGASPAPTSPAWDSRQSASLRTWEVTKRQQQKHEATGAAAAAAAGGARGDSRPSFSE